jgi:hypothetical protein
VENAAGGGYEQVVGDHAVKMNGRSYHFLSKKASGGLSYFTFDGLAKAQEHAAQLNLPLSEAQRAKAGMELGMLKGIFQELKDYNEFVQELGWIGDGLQKNSYSHGWFRSQCTECAGINFFIEYADFINGSWLHTFG